ncbi:MAG: hypothetical protein ACK5MD_00925 [Flavobacteriales bacterium]
MMKKLWVLFFFIPCVILAQECEKVIVNKVSYDCFYDGSWDISEGNLAMIEYVKSRSTGISYIEYTTKDYLDQTFYNYSKNFNVDWGKYAPHFSLKNFKIYINGKKYRFPYAYEQIIDLGNFKTVTAINRKRKKIHITSVEVLK